MGDCWQWQAWETAGSGKQLDNSLKETHVVSIMRYQLLATGANLALTKRTDSPLQHQIRWQPKTERENPNHLTKRMKVLWIKRAESHDGEKMCTYPSCRYRHPPVCQNYISETGCRHCKKSNFRHVELEVKPNKKSEKGGAKGSVAMLKDLTQMNCVSQDPHPKKSILRKEGQLGSIRKVQFSRSTWHHIKNRERKCPSQGIIQKCEPHERCPCAPKFVERSQQDTLQQERCARRVAWNLASFFDSNSRILEKATIYFLVEDWETKNDASAGTYFTIARGEREFAVDSGASKHMLSRKNLSSDEMDAPKRSRHSHSGHDGQWGSANIRGGTHTCSRSWFIRNSAITR